MTHPPGGILIRPGQPTHTLLKPSDIANAELTAGLENASLAALGALAASGTMPPDEFLRVLFGGVVIGPDDDMSHAVTNKKYDLSQNITDAQLSMSQDQITQITFTVQDPGLTYYKSGLFYEGGLCTYRGFPYIVSTTDVNGGTSGVGAVTVNVRPWVVQALKNRQGPLTMNNVLRSDFVVAECQAVGGMCIVQPTTLRTNVSREVPNETQTYALDETPSSWTTFESFAQDEGYVLFECYGIIFFCKPSWLYTEMFNAQSKSFSNIGIYWGSTASELGGNTSYGKGDPNYMITAPITAQGGEVRDNVFWQECMEVPDITVSYDQQQGPAWTVTAQVPIQAAQRFFLGQRLTVRGMGAFNEAAALLVSSIQYSMAGTANATVTATSPYDPKPPINTTARNGAVGGGMDNIIDSLHMKPGRYGTLTLDSVQLANAVQIYKAGYDRHAPGVDIVCALDTGIIESTLHRYYNPQVPASEKVPNDGPPPYGGAPLSDHSMGVFQQRDSWGTVATRMDAYSSAGLFYTRLAKIPHSGTAASNDQIGSLCQQVQVSAFGFRYALEAVNARVLYIAINAAVQKLSAGSTDGWVPGHPISSKRAADFVNIALSQVGKTYIYGYNVPSLVPPLKAYDCSLLVQWAAFQVGVNYPRDTRSQVPWVQTHGTTMSVDSAFKVRGAVLFKFNNNIIDGPHSYHTGISLGDGRTVEAYDTGIGVIINSPSKFGEGGWGLGAKVPGMIYP